MSAQWTTAREYTDIKYETTDNGSIAKITINRPHVRNAFRPLTVHEMLNALNAAHEDPRVGVVILTGEGPDAFCSGGDQKVRGNAGYIGEDGVPRLNILDVQRTIRTMPKPVVAMVAGYAIAEVTSSTSSATSPLPRTTPNSDRQGPKWALLTEASAPPTWRASWARKKRGKSGTCAGSTMPGRRWTWAWSTPWFPWRTWRRKRSPGAARCSATALWPCAA